MTIDYKKLADILETKVRSLWKDKNLSHDIILKGDHDVVTATDIAFEKALIDEIHTFSPDIPILSEETNSETIPKGTYYTIDPIDGTWNYSHNVPIYGTQISLVENDEPVFGLIYLPIFDYMFEAIKDNGCYLNNESISVKQYSKKQSIIAVTDLRRNANDLPILLEFSKLITEDYGRPRMSGCTCFDMAMVAKGAYQGKVSFKYNYWDVLPGIILTNEAGGYAVYKKDYALAASSKELAEDLTRTLNEAKKVIY